MTADESHVEHRIEAVIAGGNISLRPGSKRWKKNGKGGVVAHALGSAHPPWIVNMIIAGDPEAVRVNPFNVYWTLRFAVTVEPLGAFT